MSLAYISAASVRRVENIRGVGEAATLAIDARGIDEKIHEIRHTWAARYVARACRRWHSLAKRVGRPHIMLIPRERRV